MSVPNRSVTGKQPPAKVHPPTPSTNPETDNSPLLKSITVVHSGPGRTWFNLTRKDVKEKLSKYCQKQVVTDQGSLWRRLLNAFGKSRKSI